MSLRQSINAKYVFAVLTASLGSGFQHGYHYGIVNIGHSIIKEWIKETKIQRYRKVPSENEIMQIWSLVTSVFSFGGIVGSSLTAVFANKFGHKGGLLWNNIIMIIAAVLIFLAKFLGFYEMLIAGRFLIGIHAGLNSGLCPIYLTEVAPVSIRGSTTALYSLVMNMSFFMSQLFSLEFTLGNKEEWVNPIVISVIPTVVQLIALSLCPESPRFLLITLNDEEKAKKALMWFRNTKRVNFELLMMKKLKKVLEEIPKVSIKTIFTDSIYRTPLLIALAVEMGQHFCGIETVLYFSSAIMQRAGLTLKEAHIANIIMGSSLVVFGIISLVLIETLGRRLLFQLSLCGLAADKLFMIMVLKLSEDAIVRQYTHFVIATSVVLLAAWYALGTNSVPLVVTVELFNHLARPFAASVVVPLGWLTSFLVNITYLSLLENLGYYVYVIYLCLDLIFFLFANMYLPETKGKSSKQIINMFYTLDLEYSRKRLPSMY